MSYASIFSVIVHDVSKKNHLSVDCQMLTYKGVYIFDINFVYIISISSKIWKSNLSKRNKEVDESSCRINYVLPGCTDNLLHLDLKVNKVYKDILKAQF